MSGSTATNTDGKSATVGEHEEQHTLSSTGVFGKDVDERCRLFKNLRVMFSPIGILFSGKVRYTAIT